MILTASCNSVKIRKPLPYKDRWFRIAAALTGALLASELGGTTSVVERLFSKWFYIEYGSSALIALLVVECVACMTRKLDAHYDWVEATLIRSLLQVLLGVLLPGVMAFGLAAIYFGLFGMNILTDTWYVHYSLPFIMLLITLFNVYYLAHYFYLRQGHSEYKEILIISEGSKSFPIPTDTICFIQRQNSGNFVYTFDGKSFLVLYSLDELQEALDPRRFFRINRQVIIHMKACRYFQSSSYGKLKLFLHSPAKEPVTVSQGKASKFKKWVERSYPN